MQKSEVCPDQSANTSSRQELNMTALTKKANLVKHSYIVLVRKPAQGLLLAS